MTVYRTILASEVDPESPLRSTLAVAWTDNLLAHIEGDATIPAALVAHHYKSTQVFETSGTWVKPTGVNFIRVRTVGGGGGASGSGNAGGTTQCGGAGAHSYIDIDVSGSGNETVTIGAGGAGGVGAGTTNTAGATGGVSTFGAHTSCAGGIGGNVTTTGGRGGAIPSLGLVKSGGGSAQDVGGASYYGGGASSPDAAGNGLDAIAFGSGGGKPFASGTTRTGGAGKHGVIIVEEYS